MPFKFWILIFDSSYSLRIWIRNESITDSISDNFRWVVLIFGHPYFILEPARSISIKLNSCKVSSCLKLPPFLMETYRRVLTFSKNFSSETLIAWKICSLRFRKFIWHTSIKYLDFPILGESLEKRREEWWKVNIRDRGRFTDFWGSYIQFREF